MTLFHLITIVCVEASKYSLDCDKCDNSAFRKHSVCSKNHLTFSANKKHVLHYLSCISSGLFWSAHKCLSLPF